MPDELADSVRVLLVDDDTRLLRSLSRVLVERGFEVEAATGAAEAAALLRRGHFDALICDQKMPGRSGLEFVAGIRKELPNLVTMILSGQVDGNRMAHDWANEIGVVEVFSKPCDPYLIADSIDTAVMLRHRDPVGTLPATSS